MKHLRLRRPLPLSGVALETAALGILLQNYADIFPSFCGVLATVFLSLVLLKYLCFPANIQEGRERSGTCRRCSTFTMAMMILSTFLEP